MKLSTERLDEVKGLVASRLGLFFPPDREEELARAVFEGARSAHARSTDVYLAQMARAGATHAEWRRLASLLTIGETSFFRDPPCIAALEGTVLPGLIAAREAEGKKTLRLWSAGCSTGEEAYSLAILLERLLPLPAEWDATILATDINPRALEKARRGLYREWALRNLPPSVRARYFARHAPGVFELKRRLRDRVCFETENLALETARGPLDLILCRNVLMYLTPEAARAAVARLVAALAEDGWLLVAPAEASSERFRPLVAVNFPGAIFFQRADASPRVTPRAWSQGGRGARARAAPLPPRVGPKVVVSAATEPRPPEVPSPAERLARARSAGDEGRLDEAIGLCRQLLSGDPFICEAHLLLAAIHQEQGNLEGAFEALRRAVYLDPDSAEAHLALGHLLLKKSEGRRGRKHLETAARLAKGTEAG